MTSIDAIRSFTQWRQRIPLGDSETTNGYLLLPNEWELNYLPADMSGKSFLDVGANDGYFAFEAERRGATESIASDLYFDGLSGNKGGWNRKGIQLIKDHLKSNVQIIHKSIYDLNDLPSQYDIVLCSNVLSWLDNPLLGIERLATSCKETLFIKDGFLITNNSAPLLRYDAETHAVFYRANLKYMETTLRKFGFRKIEFQPFYNFLQFQWQMENFPIILNNEPLDVHLLPTHDCEFVKSSCHNKWILGAQNDFYFVRGLGWVKKEKVHIQSRKSKSIIKKLLKSLLSNAQYDDWSRMKSVDRTVKSFMVIAHR
ncbi:MAG: class I SAM-dependent methyltransferase [Flavobacteriales bacterium]